MKNIFSLIRNIGIIAHVDAGKTTTTERILFFTGFSHKIGEVHNGNTVTDWMKQEQERGITITSASVTIFWKIEDKNYKINLIDTPGHVDFTIEVERSLRILDGAVILVCATSGIQPQTETVWNQTNKFNIPKIIFVNKMDRIGSNYLELINNIELKFQCKLLIISINIGKENDFVGIIDIIDMKSLIWKNDIFIKENIKEDYINQSNYYRNLLLENLSNLDEFFLEKYISNSYNKKDILTSIRNLVINNKIIPILCGSSLKNKGIELLLDSICNFLPSPIDIGIKNCNNNNYRIEKNSLFLALLFKIQHDPFLGTLSFIRIYSGTIKNNDIIFNYSKNIKEKVFRILRMFSNSKQDISEAYAGDIVALIGLKSSFTGDTFCDFNKKLLLEKINLPIPVISISIEPIFKNDKDKLINILQKINKEDPSFIFNILDDTGELIISGMGELHLEIIIDRINNDYKIKTKTSKPQVSYKESIKKTVIQEGKYIKQTGGRGQYGHVIIKIEPLDFSIKDEIIFKIDIIGGSIPKEYFLPIEKGIFQQLKNGVILGYPVTKIKISLIDGTYHSVDSSEYAFRNAASIALKNALKQADSFLLEPIMKLEISTPDEYLGIVLSDINKKRGNVVSVKDYKNFKLINSQIPLRELFGYSTDLRSNTKGRATFNIEFKNYAEVPNYIIEKIKK